MTESILDLTVAALQLVAALFFLASAVGTWRFPDFATRVHSPTKAASLGIALLALALALHQPTLSWLAEIGLLVLFVFATIPLGTQILLKAGARKRLSPPGASSTAADSGAREPRP